LEYRKLIKIVATISRYSSFTLQARDQTEFTGDFETTW
jgi:hypothetical protein